MNLDIQLSEDLKKKVSKILILILLILIIFLSIELIKKNAPSKVHVGETWTSKVEVEYFKHNKSVGSGTKISYNKVINVYKGIVTFVDDNKDTLSLSEESFLFNSTLKK